MPENDDPDLAELRDLMSRNSEAIETLREMLEKLEFLIGSVATGGQERTPELQDSDLNASVREFSEPP